MFPAWLDLFIFTKGLFPRLKICSCESKNCEQVTKKSPQNRLQFEQFCHNNCLCVRRFFFFFFLLTVFSWSNTHQYSLPNSTVEASWTPEKSSSSTPRFVPASAVTSGRGSIKRTRPAGRCGRCGARTRTRIAVTCVSSEVFSWRCGRLRGAWSATRRWTAPS